MTCTSNIATFLAHKKKLSNNLIFDLTAPQVRMQIIFFGIYVQVAIMRKLYEETV